MSSLVGDPARAVRSRLLQWRDDESGAVAILFSLTALVIFALVGGAIDYGRAVHARYQIQEAVDSAVLAAARVWQTENDIDLAEKKGLEHYKNNKPEQIDSQVSKFTPDLANNTISMEAVGTVKTPFLGVIRIPSYTVSARSQAMLQVGGNGERSLEIAMMLDVTGSMEGQKISDLKAAAKDLIDIVVWDDQSEYKSRVAIVPFSNVVNVGSATLANSVRGNLKTGDCLTSSNPCTGFLSGLLELLLGWAWGKPATWYEFTEASRNACDNSNSKCKFKVSDRCVTERTGSQAYTDAAPDSQSNKLGPAYMPGVVWPSDAGKNKHPCGTGGIAVDDGDSEVNSVQPLSSEKEMLKRRIDKLKTGGGTAGHLGTAWAWYMLSPNWAYLWPSANRPEAYGTDNLDKIAILMTDGEYNTMYCNGAEAKNSNGAKINCNATNGTSTNQARELCTKMKEKGILVYTVGFELGGPSSTAYKTLQQCASSADKFYNAEDGEQLRLAFRDIAVRLATLRLSQ
jgi:Flp pilus assembly protein TadG